MKAADAAEAERRTLKRWLRARLTEGDAPREEWRALWEASWEHLLALPARSLIDRDALDALADRLTDPKTIAEVSTPDFKPATRAIIDELREADQPIDRLLPAEAREKLDEALARPGLIHPDWVHTVFRGEAAETVLSDALYGALKDFSTLLPRTFVKMSPLGKYGLFGGAGAIAEKLIDDLEKLIEPEIRSFLSESTGRLLEHTAEFTIAKLDDPALIEFRSNLIDFMLSKSPAFFLQGVDQELLDDLGVIGSLSAQHAATMPDTRAGLHTWIDRVLDAIDDKSVGDLLQLDADATPAPLDALADATWPLFTALLTGPQSQSWMDGLVDELIDEYERISKRD